MRQRIKDWLLRLTEPWREEQASLDLEWRLYAQKMNAAGARPQYWYPGCELNPTDKLKMYEFPYGPDSEDDPIDPDSLKRQLLDEAKAHTLNRAKDRLG
jgi:hypothetical protein